jgi:hypothetical protein
MTRARALCLVTSLTYASRGADQPAETPAATSSGRGAGSWGSSAGPKERGLGRAIVWTINQGAPAAQRDPRMKALAAFLD